MREGDQNGACKGRIISAVLALLKNEPPERGADPLSVAVLA